MNPQSRVRIVQRPAKPCSADGIRCITTSDPKKETNVCCIKHNLIVLGDTIVPLNSAGIPWWIDYGMLLGYCTGGKPGGLGGHEGGIGRFYWNDKDCDLGCVAEDREAVLALVPIWKAQGHSVNYSHPRLSDIYGGRDLLQIAISLKNTNKTDIVFWHRRDDSYLDREFWCSTDLYKGREMPLEWVFPTTLGTWEGIEINLPADPEKLIAHRYGVNWRNLPSQRHSSQKR